MTTSAYLQVVYDRLRQQVAYYDKDRYFASDIEAAKQLVLNAELIDNWAALRENWFLAN
ncbi:hypothetical protein [Moraxella osloensis]|uniref:hypothetical protein n=1 Tax=Faucicola osloensis TaxID=34062 RepID=UPI0015E14318|nr:hypothetical protein [Moraxella osloensis]